MASSDDATRFSPITPDDHAGSVWISASLCLIYSVVTFGLRAHIRRKTHGTDDYLAFVATVLQLGEVAAVMVGLHHGLGKTQELLRQSELTQASRAAFASEILFLLALSAAKASTLYLMMRLFNLSGSKATFEGRSRIFYWFALAFLTAAGLWGILSVVAISVDCSTADFIRGNASQCSRQFLRWQLITAFDVAIECLMILLAIVIVLPVHISLALKCQVVLAFSFRLPLVALSVLHLKFISEYTTSRNPGVAFVTALVLQQVQLCWSLISATIPNLKSFVKSFSSGFGIQLDPSISQAYGSGGRSRRHSGYELGSFGKGNSKNRSADRSANDTEEPGTSPQDMRNDSKAGDQESVDSTGSQDHIIRKDVQWTIRYETDTKGN
ncbi:hypothetical protein PV08_07746 [Exophiala spinifera]|uniref:Rhodopsin domain-containing protein n=1 Tax=Exophiala spinifera TaxID=91928 RepID=A0A0D2BUQ5_9EURO|nr:uncharacterized protein PV08_07746 [Exophiala spinifera]KIW14959.1 hypothetical protein PV08_07746 [Exophiala spinifera]